MPDPPRTPIRAQPPMANMGHLGTLPGRLAGILRRTRRLQALKQRVDLEPDVFCARRGPNLKPQPGAFYLVVRLGGLERACRF